jgi:hypothetical protein
MRELELAKPNLTKDRAAELETRFRWLQEFAIINTTLDESLWHYRYVRHLASMLTTDPDEMKFLDEASARVREHQPKLFQYDPEQKFSCYGRPLGQLATKPGLGNPLPLMKELHDQSRVLIEQQAGPIFGPPAPQR